MLVWPRSPDSLDSGGCANGNMFYSLERVVRIDEAATASGKAADLAQLRFTEGVADFLQVLDAERTQLDAERQLAQGRTQAATAFAALVKALGGSWPH